MAGSKRWPIANTSFSWLRSASSAEAMSGYCSLHATSRAVEQRRAMDLAQRRGERGLLVELARTSPASPAPARSPCGGARRASPSAGALACSCASSRGIFRRQRVGDGGDELRRLHQRPLQAAQRRLQLGRVLVAVELAAEIALAGQPRRQAADRRCRPGRSGRAGRRGELLARRPCVGSSHLSQLLELVDEARDDAQALVPEAGIGGVEAERRQQLLVPLACRRPSACRDTSPAKPGWPDW